MKKVVIKILIMVFIVTSVVGVVDYAYIVHSINYGTMGECKNDSAYIENVPDNIQICNFGNSHGYYGFNYDSYDDYVCFNFSLPSQSMSYNYRILENYKDNIAPGAFVFICVSHSSFFGADETDRVGFDSKNKRYYHFLNQEYIKEYDMKMDIFVNYLPALTTNIWDLVKTTIGFNRSQDMWDAVTNKESAAKHGPKRYEAHVVANIDNNGKRVFNDEEIDSLYKMIELCNEINATPVLITTPYLAEYTNSVYENDAEFYHDFYSVITNIEKDTGVECYDYQFDERFLDKYEWFMNTDHLNRKGAENFTDIIMKEIVLKNS